MIEKDINRVRKDAKVALLQGASGEEIALLFKAAEVNLLIAESEMRALEFFALAIVNEEVSKLYVSKGFSQPGIATLLLDLRYKEQPSIDW